MGSAQAEMVEKILTSSGLLLMHLYIYSETASHNFIQVEAVFFGEESRDSKLNGTCAFS